MLRFFRVDKFLNNTRNLLLYGGTNEICPSVHNVLVQCQMISISGTDRMDLCEEDEKKRKKTPRISKITLINPDESVTITGLEAAEKIAKRRNLKLIKMPHIGTRSDRDIYKLYNEADFVNEEQDTFSEKASESKTMRSTKLFPIRSKINDHDLEIKISNINRLLEKNYRIKLLVSCTAEDKVRRNYFLDITFQLVFIVFGANCL